MKIFEKLKKHSADPKTQKEFQEFLAYAEDIISSDAANAYSLIKLLAVKYQTGRQLAVMSGSEPGFFTLPGEYIPADEWIHGCGDSTFIRPFSLADDAVITNIWSDVRLADCMENIGSDVGNPFHMDPRNHRSEVIIPIGLMHVYNGNHSANAGIAKREGSLTPTEVIDWRPIYKEGDIYFDGTSFYSKKGLNLDTFNAVPIEIGYMFEVGRILYSKM